MFRVLVPGYVRCAAAALCAIPHHKDGGAVCHLLTNNRRSVIWFYQRPCTLGFEDLHRELEYLNWGDSKLTVNRPG